MGGSGITIEIEATRAQDVLAPAEFHRRLWSGWVRTDIRNRLGRAANRQVLSYYLDAEASDGFDSGQWSSGPTGLDFVFHDGGGCGMSENAALHWIEVSLANMVHEFRDFTRWAESCGYRIKPRRTIHELIAATPSYPLVELRRALYCVAAPREGSDDPVEIFTDDGAGPLEYETLTDDERARVDTIARTRKCACEMCEHIRGIHTRAAARQAAKSAAAAETDAAKRDATAKTGATKAGTAQTDASKKPATAKPGAAKTGTAKTGTAKTTASKKTASRTTAANKTAAKKTASKAGTTARQAARPRAS